MKIWLQTKIGVINLPLSYAICNYTTPLTMDQSEFIINNSIWTTGVFKINSKKVANILTPLVLNTGDFEWGGINFTYNMERKGWLDLVSRYNEYSDYERCIVASRQNLSTLFYMKTSTFNFDTLSTKLKATLDTMEKYGEGRPE